MDVFKAFWLPLYHGFENLDLLSLADNNLAMEVQKTMIGIPESPFIYPAIYTAPTVAPFIPKAPEPEWWDEETSE